MMLLLLYATRIRQHTESALSMFSMQTLLFCANIILLLDFLVGFLPFALLISPFVSIFRSYLSFRVRLLEIQTDMYSTWPHFTEFFLFIMISWECMCVSVSAVCKRRWFDIALSPDQFSTSVAFIKFFHMIKSVRSSYIRISYAYILLIRTSA